MHIYSGLDVLSMKPFFHLSFFSLCSLQFCWWKKFSPLLPSQPPPTNVQWGRIYFKVSIFHIFLCVNCRKFWFFLRPSNLLKVEGKIICKKTQGCRVPEKILCQCAIQATVVRPLRLNSASEATHCTTKSKEYSHCILHQRSN